MTFSVIHSQHRMQKLTPRSFLCFNSATVFAFCALHTVRHCIYQEISMKSTLSTLNTLIPDAIAVMI